MFFVANRKKIFALIGFLAALSVAALLGLGLPFGIDFTGGTLMELEYVGSQPERHLLEEALDTSSLDLGNYSLRATGDTGYLLRTRDITEEEHTEILSALTLPERELHEIRRATVGPVIGEELKNKAFAAIGVVVLLIILYVAFAFRNVRTEDEETHEYSPGVSSWTYGFIAIFVLAHDLLIPLGIFSVLGFTFGAEVDVLIVMALLTILGYSVNDTIVIFDRVRENLKRHADEGVDESFASTVGQSLSQTYARSINTSLTTLFVVLSLLVFGGPTTSYFALTLAAGVLAGTYSSLAIAAPLLVTVEARQKRKKADKGGATNAIKQPKATPVSEPKHEVGETLTYAQAVSTAQTKPPKSKKNKNRKKKRRKGKRT